MTVDLDVVIPVRDVDAYLPEALDSVLSQLGVSTTVYVVDAGSRRPVAIPTFLGGSSVIRVLRSDEPLRAGAARNVGVAAGSSPWISFLDADDLWESGSRRALIDAAISSNADIAVGSITHFADDVSAHRLRLPPDGQKALVPGGIVVRRDAWNVVGAFDPALSVGEFIDWHNRAGLSGLRETAIDEAVLRRRVHPHSTTVRELADRSDYLEVVRRWIARSN